MTTSSASANEIIRRGLLKIDDTTVLATVDSLNLKGSNKVQAVVGMPLRTLQQRRDVTTFAATAPMAAVKGILELLAMEPLGNVVEALGDHADSPSFEQLSAAVDLLSTNGATNDDIVALLVFAIGEEFPAAGHCRRLLDERPEFELPPLPVTSAPTSLLVPKQVDADVKEHRRARREQEKLKKQSANTARPVRPAKVKAPKPAPIESDVAPPSKFDWSEGDVVVVRREIELTPAERANFDSGHALAGSVLLADVPYDAVDPNEPDQRSKHRPVLVVAGSEKGVLVRAIYSNATATRTLFQPWRRLALDHVSYIDSVRVTLTESSDLGERIGKLTDDEWNTLARP
jgi:hypothetical protein